MVSSTLCLAVHILGSQNVFSRAEGIADHYWPWAVFFSPFPLPPGSEALPAGFGALPAGSRTPAAGSENLPAGSEALPAGSKAQPA